jgi:Flp pilus assembly protein TadG
MKRHDGRPCRVARREKRPGIATVEFALFATLLGLIVCGMIELSRAFMAKEVLMNASRRGASVGIKPKKTYTDIQNAVDDILATDQQLPATIANGKAHLVVTVATWNASTNTYGPDVTVTAATFAPRQNDKVAVKVWANVSDCNLLFLKYMTGKVEGETVTMMRQQ